MSLELTLTIDDAKALRAFEIAPATMVAILGRRLDRAAQLIAAVERQEAPKGATSQLANSIMAAKTGELERIVAPGTDYAEYVHGGRKPGRMPDTRPGSSLYEWVKRRLVGSRNARKKGGAERVENLAFLVGRSIAAKGIAPNPFAHRAIKSTESQVLAELRAGVDEALQQVFA